MLTSDTWSSGTTELATRPSPRLSYRDRALMFGGVAAVLALVTVGLIAADMGLHDRIPDPLPTGVGLLALVSVGASLALWARSSADVATARRGEVVVAAIGELAAEMEQMSARLGTIETAFEAGRRFQELASERNRPRAVN